MNSHESIRYVPIDDHIVNIVLNRPDAKNSINTAMRKGLAEALDRAESDKKIRVIILSASGTTFSAGNDLKEPFEYDNSTDFILAEYKPLLSKLSSSKKITISAVQGSAAGIGIAFAMSCDFCLMADNASVFPAFINIALVPDGGASWHLAQAMGYRKALEATLLGRKIPAQECFDYGLANSIVAEDELLSSARQLAEAIAEKSFLAVQETKAVIKKSTHLDLDSVIELEAHTQEKLSSSKDFKEALAAFVEKRAPVFK